ncbi:hypothetical protein [Streptosporangium subroseum]|uniref:hypothetical protein n=1 Tax=Streptosporangium subroseum TaxID=106412 RepID=UPI003085F333|nr:hypothetical protein OHB15_25355 [Streptosporangium subroseum]
MRTFDLPGLPGLGAMAVNEALRGLGEHGMAVRTRDGWVRGPADPGKVADQLGVPALIEAIMKRYRKQRKDYRAWLGIVAALELRFDSDAEGWSLPDEMYETLARRGGRSSNRTGRHAGRSVLFVGGGKQSPPMVILARRMPGLAPTSTPPAAAGAAAGGQSQRAISACPRAR